jgi:hypothetical protein
MRVHNDEGGERTNRLLGPLDKTGGRGGIAEIVFPKLGAHAERARLVRDLLRVAFAHTPRLGCIERAPTRRRNVPAIGRQALGDGRGDSGMPRRACHEGTSV